MNLDYYLLGVRQLRVNIDKVLADRFPTATKGCLAGAAVDVMGCVRDSIEAMPFGPLLWPDGTPLTPAQWEGILKLHSGVKPPSA